MDTLRNVKERDSGLESLWLQSHIVPQYWKGKQVWDPHERAGPQLATDWEKYQMRMNELYSTSEKVRVSEENVIREVLWMLAATEDSFVYQLIDGKFVPSSAFQLGHLTHDSLLRMLTELGQYGSMAHELRTFTKNALSGTSQPLTVEAFANCISQFMEEYCSYLAKVERQIVEQDETCTLFTVLQRMEQWFHKLHVVHQVYREGVADMKALDNNTVKACHLLAVLQDTFVEHLIKSTGQREVVHILFPMWIQTCQPYLNIVDQWLTNGQLYDPRNEFIIQRNVNHKEHDETFWDKAFTVQNAASTSSGKDDSNTFDEFQEQNLILPVLREINLGGKSMELMENLGKLPCVVRSNTGKDHLTLYESFIHKMEDFLGKDNGSDIEHTTRKGHSSMPVESILPCLPSVFSNQLSLDGTRDQLLIQNVGTVFNPNGMKIESFTTKEEGLRKKMSCLNLSGITSVPVLLEHCLYPQIRQKYEYVCKQLLSVLKEEFHLMDYMRDMRSFFLMEAGDTMYDFYTPIFDKLKRHEEWRDYSLLNMLLQEALQARYPEHGQRMFAHVRDPKQYKTLQPIQALDQLTLFYKVQWPVDLVINSEAQTVYNQVFQFILQVKRAKHSLDGLRYSDLTKNQIQDEKDEDAAEILLKASAAEDVSCEVKVHRMHIFRMKLMHFVNSLHNYIMTRILHTSGLEFEEAIEKATDLDILIACHQEYMKNIFERCLLHKQVNFLKDIVTKVLNMCIACQQKWDQGIDSISTKHLTEMEAEFTQCLRFLGSFLNSVIKKGSFPHLESLAFSLLTSSEYHKKQHQT